MISSVFTAVFVLFFIALLFAFFKLYNQINDLKLSSIECNKSVQDLSVMFDKQNAILQTSVLNQINLGNANSQKLLESLHKQLVSISNLNENKIENMRKSIEYNADLMRKDNEKKLEEIRVAVQEKLQSTLEKRLGESFKIVSDQLEMVYKGLGEMRNLASGVGDLKKIFSNVKTRGVWGEVQLGNILDQVFNKEQYVANAKINPSSDQLVEYALKLPNKGLNDASLLPIDAKFPVSEYHRLVDMHEHAGKEDINKQLKLLVNCVKREAKSISEKYIYPPNTTDFAIMFLPIEGLYSEVVKFPGLSEEVYRNYKIIITSPTTLVALLNSIQMGYRTLIIEKKSHLVWELLDSVKHEFSVFMDLLGKTKIKLDQASKAIGVAEKKSSVIKTKLDDVGTLNIDYHE